VERLPLPVTSHTSSGDSITLPQIPCRKPGCSWLVKGLMIEIHFLPSSVLSSSKVLETGILNVVHEATTYPGGRLFVESVMFSVDWCLAECVLLYHTAAASGNKGVGSRCF
jgi:hypothetical protein